MTDGGQVTEGNLAKGYFVAPTLFSKVSQDMTVAREKIFGPVLCAIPFEDEDDAVAKADDTIYGLASGVWGSQARTSKVTRKLKAGTVWVNTYYTIPAEDPWGGFKQSGLGRENAIYGLEAFLEIKTIYEEPSGAVSNLTTRLYFFPEPQPLTLTT